MGELPEMALSIMQPWAGLIVHGLKDIENRSWPTRYRGPVMIHAGKKLDADVVEDLATFRHPVTGEPMNPSLFDGTSYPRGGIVGVAEIVDCVSSSASHWFVGEYGFLIRNARPVPFIPCRGALGFFRPDFSPPVAVVPKVIAPPDILDRHPDLFPTDQAHPQ